MEKESIGDDWQAWLQLWGDRLLLFARQHAPSLAEAEDLVQDAFVEIWTRRDQWPRLDPGLFFTRIRRLAVDRARQRQRRERREKSYAEAANPSSFNSLMDGDGPDLHEALSRLPVEQREVLVLRVWADLSYEEIGRTLGISPNTAASRQRYGLEALRRHLMDISPHAS